MLDRLLKFNPKGYVHSIRHELMGVVLFLAVIWLVFGTELVLPVSLNHVLGLVPRSVTGLPGILCMPFLHRDFAHIFSNSVPLLVLCSLLAGSRAKSSIVVAGIILLSGVFIWCLAPGGTAAVPKTYVGASALVFGLITFLISSGLFERRPVPVAIAIVVGLMYGGSLLYELSFLRALFSRVPDVSWSAHLYGALSGVAIAFLMTHEQGRKWLARFAPRRIDAPKS